MPNYCTNVLTLIGDSEEIARFIEENSGTSTRDSDVQPGEEKVALLFSKAVPVPEDQTEDWFVWSLSNWGTKWEPVLWDTSAWWTISEANADLRFDTAWSPPVPWLSRVAAQYPNLHFVLEYVEDGSQFAGVAEGKGTINVVELEYIQDPNEDEW